MCGIREGELEIGGSFFFGSRGEQTNRQGLEIAWALPGPRVAYADDTTTRAELLCDTIHFDDHDGACQAVRHLWRRGHRSMAFVALHGRRTPAMFAWSRRREAGFSAAMQQLGGAPRVFRPLTGPVQVECDQPAYGKEACRPLIPLLQQKAISAVVCANHAMLIGLIEAAREANLPESCWPALIAFDDYVYDDNLPSVLRLPWNDLGAAAAGALWERTFGSNERKQAPPREILVPMRLVARLSCAGNHRLSRNTMAAVAI